MAAPRPVDRTWRAGPGAINVRRLVQDIILVTVFLVAGAAGAQDRVGAYDFAYRLAGDARARPVQVFDDGKDTFFQFRPGEPVPAIFADAGAGPRLLAPQGEGPYVKVPAVADGFFLRLGLGAATVAYIGAPRAPGANAPASLPDPVRRAPPSPTPPPQTSLQLAASVPVSGLPRDLLSPAPRPRITLEEGSYATPLKGDAIEWTSTPERVRLAEIHFGKESAVLTPTAVRQVRTLVQESRPASRFELTAWDDAGNKQGLAEARARAVEAALLAAGAAARNVVRKVPGSSADAGTPAGGTVTIRVTDVTTHAIGVPPTSMRDRPAPPSVIEPRLPAPAPSPQTWAVRKADGTLEKMLARWAREAGWTLVWKDGPAVAITGDASLSRPDYLQAADYALEQARSAGYRLRATAYSNQVLVVTSEE